jgi:mannose-6-phosphate isomerase-like protein (cupin superfamily)
MKTSITQALARLPAAPADKYPQGAPFVTMLAGGTMSVEVFAPKGADLQQPHTQDELYFIHSGTGQIVIQGQRFDAAAGDAFFVGAGVEHRFENFSHDFVTWVIFYGPQGGEKI